ncbi:unnamed protein product, partial [Didymodactylos carnosus]
MFKNTILLFFVIYAQGEKLVCQRYNPSADYSLQENNSVSIGLQKCNACLNIAVIGAGVSGLVTAVEMSMSGHKVTIFEASDRIGGRVNTYRSKDGKFLTELGAMRFPLDHHTMLKTYLSKRYKIPIEPFIEEDPNTIMYINDILTTSGQAQRNPNIFEYNVKPSEKGKTPTELWDKATKPIVDMIQNHGYPSAVEKWGSYSVEQYLVESGLSRDAINYISLTQDIETLLYTSVI